MKKILYLILLLFFQFHFLSAQQKMEHGTYISENKLCYITILYENKFTYIEYLGYSPYTLEKKYQMTNKNERTSCGVIGYFGNGSGKGFYEIVNGNLKLKFTEMTKQKFDIDKDFLFFDISKMIKDTRQPYMIDYDFLADRVY